MARLAKDVRNMANRPPAACPHGPAAIGAAFRLRGRLDVTGLDRELVLLSVPDKLALVYQPNSYTRRGPPETCMQIVQCYPALGLQTKVMLARARVATPDNVESIAALPRWLDWAPWRLVRPFGIEELNRRFLRQVEKLDPARTIVIIWPGWPIPPLESVKRLGFTLVREMINCACAVSKPILDSAYARQGLPADHNVSAELVRAETEELQLYDHIFSPSAAVDDSLRAIGIPDSRILKSSFGWNPKRFASSTPESKPPGLLRFLFVGSIGVRKGVPELFEAWKTAALPNAELVLVGNIEPAFAERFRTTAPQGVRHIGFTPDIGGWYKSADAFVFPSHEEGAPQVVYEAGGCGAPVVTTEMGRARLIEDGANGLIVPAGDPSALAATLQRLAGDAALRARLGKAAAETAQAFQYQLVGEQRARMLAQIASLDRSGEQTA